MLVSTKVRGGVYIALMCLGGVPGTVRQFALILPSDS